MGWDRTSGTGRKFEDKVMSKIAWKVKGLYRQDPNEVKEELETLGDKYSLHDVVENARSETSVMHDMFEWDDSIAGEKYREVQAGKIIRSLVIVEDMKEDVVPVRYFMSTGDRTNEYTPIRLIVRQKDEYQGLLERAKADLIAFKIKYNSLNELDELIRLIDEII